MVLEVLDGLPGWLVLGVTLGLVASVAAAGVFAVGIRLFPTERRTPGQRIDGDGRRRAEIRRYLAGIGEAFSEDHDVAGQDVAFYLPDRDVAITFDPRAYYRIRRTGTHAVLVEHEMPGVNLGYRLPFETPPVSGGHRGAAPDHAAGTDPEATAFSVLGLPSTATEREVTTAYREMVKEVHPDHGGDTDAFRRLREAYTAAKEASGT